MEGQQAGAGAGAWRSYAGAAAAGAAGLALLSTMALADEAEHGLDSPHYPWSHDGFFR